MNKRWLTLLLMLAMVFASAVGMAEDDNPCAGGHEWVESEYQVNDCYVEMQCKNCDEYCSHSWQIGRDKSTCSICGSTCTHYFTGLRFCVICEYECDHVGLQGAGTCPKCECKVILLKYNLQSCTSGSRSDVQLVNAPSEGSFAPVSEYKDLFVLTGISGPEGYTFDSWRLTKSNGDYYGEYSETEVFRVPINDRESQYLTATPRWYKHCTISFSGGSGTCTADPMDETVWYGSAYNKITLPSSYYVTAPDAEHKFAGWSDGTTTYAAGAEYTVEDSITLTAVWTEIEKVTVTFHANDGTNRTATQTLPKDDYEYLMANAFVREGYTFDAWNTQADGSGDLYSDERFIQFTEDLDLFAQWDVNPCNVRYDPQDGTGKIYKYSNQKYYGDVVTMNDPVKWLKITAPENCEFVGWKDEAGVMHYVGEKYTIKGDMLMTAVWQPKDAGETTKYTITYEAGGASGSVPASVQVEAGKQHPAAEPTGLNAGEGKQFDGWLVKGTQTKYHPEQPITVNSDMTLVAQWKDRKVSLSYQDASGKEVHKVEKTYGQSHTVLTAAEAAELGLAVPTGYQFAGWQLYNNEGGKLKDVTATAGQPLTLYSEWWIRPIWEKIVYKITFEANGASGSIAAVQVEPGAKYRLPSPEGFEPGEGKQFDGWLVKGTETKYGPGKEITVEGNMTLVAQWKDRKVSLSYQDVSGKEVHKVEKTYGQSHTVLTPQEAGLTAETGYQFAGWQLYNNKGGKIEDVTATAGQPLTLRSEWWIRPIWERIVYKVSFDANGASGTMDAVTVGENDSYKVPANAFTAPKGHHFGGWTLDGVPVAVGDTITVSKPITLKALWEKNIYTVKTMDSNAASSAVSEQKEYGTKITLPACPYTATSKYHSFAYWKVEDALGVSKLKPGASVTVESDTVISAIWDFDDSVKTRVEQVEDIASLPPQEKKELEKQMLQEMPPKLQTIEAVVEELAEQTQDEGFVAEQTEVHEVKLMFKPADSDEWIEATEENFPTAGIEVRMPMPEGTNAADYEFLVIHMFTTKSDRLGTEPGKTETIVPVIENGELVFRLNGLSPVSVAWKERPMEGKLEAAQLPKTGDASCLTAWITLLGASGAGFAVIRRRKK